MVLINNKTKIIEEVILIFVLNNLYRQTSIQQYREQQGKEEEWIGQNIPAEKVDDLQSIISV